MSLYSKIVNIRVSIMSRRGGDGLLFVGRLSKNIRTRDLEDVFESHGRMSRCDIKYGAEMAYAFIDFEDRRDAEDALRYENGRDILGSSIIVEWAKGNPRRPLGYDECFKCHRVGHWARDCPDDRFYGFRRPSRRSRSRSPRRRRSRSRSPRRRSRSRSPRRRSRSRSPRRRSRSRSPRRQSRSPRQHSRSPQRHRSDSRSRSRSQDRSKRSRRSRSNSGRRAGSRSRSRSRSRNGDTRENGDH